MNKVNRSNKDRASKPPPTHNGNSDAKLQPTAEQLRIAQITFDRSDADPDMIKKMKEISDVTGRSHDEVFTALHDCNGDADQAVEVLLEKKDNEQDEWQEKKKKKKTAVASKGSETLTPTADMRVDKSESDIVESTADTSSSSRGRRDNRGPPRLQRGAGRGYINGDKSVSRERSDRPGFGGDRSSFGNDRSGTGNDRPGFGGDRSNYSADRSNYNNDRSNFNNDRSGNDRGFGNDRGYSNDRFESGRGRRRGNGMRYRGGSGRGFHNSSGNGGGFESSQSIDTWTNNIAENGQTDSTIGAWSESTDDWATDEWGGSLQESLVLERSVPAPSANTFSSGNDFNTHSTPTLQTQVFLPSGRTNPESLAPADVTPTASQQTFTVDKTSSSSYANLNQLLPKLPESYDNSISNSADQSAYLSHYAKEATECIKNAVGIGSHSSSPATNLDTSSAPPSHINSMQPTQILNNRAKQPQPQQMRPRLPPPSKIPQSAVEMPGSMASMQLDVQFGNWDAPSTMSAGDVVATGLSENFEKSVQAGSSAVSMPPMSVTKMMPEATHQKQAALGPQPDTQIPQPVMKMNDVRNSPASVPSKPATYQNSAKDLNAIKQQQQQQQTPNHMPFPVAEDNKMTYSQQQPANNSTAGPIVYNQTANVPAADKPSVFASGSETQAPPPGLPQPCNTTVPYASSTGYQVSAPVAASGNFPNSQMQFSYGFGATPTAGYGPTKAYGNLDKQTQNVYEVGNAYQTGSYQSSSSVYPGNQGTSMPYQGIGSTSNYPSSTTYISSGNGYQNPNLFRNVGQDSYQIGLSENFTRSSGQTAENFPRGTSQVADNFTRGNSQTADNFSRSSGQVGENFPRGASQAIASTVAGHHLQTSALSTSAAPSTKLIDDLSKMNVKDGASSVSSTSQYETPSVAASLTTATNTTSSAGVGLATSATPSTSVNKTMTLSTTKSTTLANKPVVNYPAALMNHPNYMIGQPPGFQLAYGYQHAQQTYQAYEDLQMQQQRFPMAATQYYDMAFQPASTLAGRDVQVPLGTQSYAGADAKLGSLDSTPTGTSLQSQQQPATGAASQYPALPPGYGYYYPAGTPSMMPMGSYYTPIIPMSGMALPMATTPTHGATVATTQYQKTGAVYGSHAGFGGQSQDFTKSFSQSQASSKGTGSNQVANHGDILLASAAGFGKPHVQGFDKTTYGGTPPPPFSIAMPVGTQPGNPAAGGAMYSGAYVPVLQHQTHSQMMHHAMVPNQDSSIGSRVQQNAIQPKPGNNKPFNPAYWQAN